ncbi:MAG: hypothetical protein OEY89_18470, partial [Gammaproteobacteria bacterium]|nr:hypothetical protein [Gammaproteobacteria bacterium]
KYSARRMGVVIPTEHSDEESKISCFIKGYHVKTSFTSKQSRASFLGRSKDGLFLHSASFSWDRQHSAYLRKHSLLSNTLLYVKNMNTSNHNCLVCNNPIPWRSKLFYNMLQGIECMKCHSSMKYSVTTNIVSFILLIAFVFSLSQFGNTYSYFYLIITISLAGSLIALLYKAKLILEFKCTKYLDNI